jgi:hypothetical protein
MRKRVMVSIVTIFKHTLRCALYASAFQKMSDGLSCYLQIFLRRFSQRELHSYLQRGGHYGRATHWQ